MLQVAHSKSDGVDDSCSDVQAAAQPQRAPARNVNAPKAAHNSAGAAAPTAVSAAKDGARGLSAGISKPHTDGTRAACKPERRFERKPGRDDDDDDSSPASSSTALPTSQQTGNARTAGAAAQAADHSVDSTKQPAAAFISEALAHYSRVSPGTAQAAGDNADRVSKPCDLQFDAAPTSTTLAAELSASGISNRSAQKSTQAQPEPSAESGVTTEGDVTPAGTVASEVSATQLAHSSAEHVPVCAAAEVMRGGSHVIDLLADDKAQNSQHNANAASAAPNNAGASEAEQAVLRAEELAKELAKSKAALAAERTHVAMLEFKLQEVRIELHEMHAEQAGMAIQI